MVRRKKVSRRRSPKTVSLWNLGVGWVYLTGFSKMALGVGPMGFLTGKSDIAAITVADAAASTDPANTDSWLGSLNYGMGR